MCWYDFTLRTVTGIKTIALTVFLPVVSPK